MAYDKAVDSAALDGALTGIANAIRGKTGGTDPLTLGQMAAAIAGIPAGGGASGIYMAQVTPSEDVGTITVEHNLGTTDILLAALWAESLGGVTPENGRGLARFWAKTEIPNNRGGDGWQAQGYWNAANGYALLAAPTSSAYWDGVVDENRFEFARPGSVSAQYAGGVTYTVVIVAAYAKT